MICKGGDYKPLNSAMLNRSAHLNVEGKTKYWDLKKPVPANSGLGGGIKPLRGTGVNRIYSWDNCKFLQLPQHFLLSYNVPGLHGWLIIGFQPKVYSSFAARSREVFSVN
jgi:hypothetical protein